MKHSSFPPQKQNCSVARSLEIVGEWWTLLVVSEAFLGARQFGDFEARLGIAKNVLSDRLSKLVKAGVMVRTAVTGRGNPRTYTLTDQGWDLLPAIIALMQWGDRWIRGPDCASVRVLDRHTGKDISQVAITTPDGKRIAYKDLLVAPGPGADDILRQRIESMYATR